MMLRRLSAIVACIAVTGSTGGWKEGAAAAQSAPQAPPQLGLRVTPIAVPEGTLRVYLPDDIAAGDTISGTVVAEPAGNTDAERSRNTSELDGYVVEVGPTKANAKSRAFLVSGLPASLSLIVRSAAGKEARRISVPVQPRQTPPLHQAGPSDFQFPRIVAGGQPCVVHGPFSGDFRNTTLSVGGQPVQPLAQSPRTFVATAPTNVQGPTNYQLNEGGVTAVAPVNVVRIQLSAPRTALTRGQHTTVTVMVQGLEGLPSSGPVRIENATPNVVTLAGGDVQVITIAPSDVRPGGTYSVDRDVTSVNPGSFSIFATIDERNRAVVAGAPAAVPAVPVQRPSAEQTGTPLRSAVIEQLDIGRMGERPFVPASEWGRLRMRYAGSARVLYVNLNVNRRWVLRNVHVLSENGPNREQTVTIPFGLGNERGVRLQQVDYGITLSSDVRSAPPAPTGRTAVEPAPYNALCGGGGKEKLPAPKVPLDSGKLDEKWGTHTHSGFPNQPAPDKGCVPTAYSNSLQWLKTKNPESMKNVNDADITIEALGRALGFKKGDGTGGDFVDNKKKYLASHHIPVDTEEIDAADVGKKMDDDCDVELWAGGDNGSHLAAVVGISRSEKNKDGSYTYTIDIAHDTTQGGKDGNTHNTETETVTYNTKTKKISGGTFVNGAKLFSFVVECPQKK